MALRRSKLNVMLPSGMARDVAAATVTEGVKGATVETDADSFKFLKDAIGQDGVDKFRRVELMRERVQDLDKEIKGFEKDVKSKEDERSQKEGEIDRINHEWEGGYHDGRYYECNRGKFRDAIGGAFLVVALWAGSFGLGYAAESQVSTALYMDSHTQVTSGQVIVKDIEQKIKEGDQTVIAAANQITGNVTYNGVVLVDPSTHAGWLAANTYYDAVNGSPNAPEVLVLNNITEGKFSKVRSYLNSNPENGHRVLAGFEIGGAVVSFVSSFFGMYYLEPTPTNLKRRRKYKKALAPAKEELDKVDAEIAKIAADVKATVERRDELKKQLREIPL